DFDRGIARDASHIERVAAATAPDNHAVKAGVANRPRPAARELADADSIVLPGIGARVIDGERVDISLAVDRQGTVDVVEQMLSVADIHGVLTGAAEEGGDLHGAQRSAGNGPV